MAAGRLRALGTAQHLKSTYGTGFHLDVTMGPSAQPPDAFVQSFCNTTTTKTSKTAMSTTTSAATTSGGGDGGGCGGDEEGEFTAQGKQVGSVVTYALPKGCFDPAEALSALQSSAKKHGIPEWSLAQPSLEEVFINIANQYTRD